MLSWNLEREQICKGYSIICGVDEAGRGSLAGPVVAAAVILPFGANIPGLNDSKKLSQYKRELLFDIITGLALTYATAEVNPNKIDQINILNATFLAMNRAVEKLDKTPDITLIDGNQNKGINYHSVCIVKGDSKSPSIAAASILAKVTRDRYMIGLSKEYPQYAFEKHKGYGTRLHYEKIKEFGISDVHRRSFLKRV